MAKEQYKHGDRVRITGIGSYGAIADGEGRATRGLVVGNTGTIADSGQTFNGHTWYSVRTDNAEHPTDFDGKGWAFYPEELEPVEVSHAS